MSPPTYDFNLPLRDALDDRGLSHSRRALAAMSMRQGLGDAYFSAAELFEAFRILETDVRLRVRPAASEGTATIESILTADGDNYQWRLYWMLSEEPVAEPVLGLVGLTELLCGRGGMARTISETGTRMPPVPGAQQR